ncbi:IMP dehydrogenase [Candidatus Gottesmanbacteria bacterium]|nr:IMP dehydrogenase [Candidatus Gottesmanbacteria bacterium]
MQNSVDKIVEEIGLTFDDVLLIPNYTEVKREDIDVSIDLNEKIKLSIPLISAPMDTVTTGDLAIVLAKLGGLGIIHRNMTVLEQVAEVEKVKTENLLAGAAVGVGDDLEERVKELIGAGADVIVVDSAHGFSKWVIEATEYISQKYKNIFLLSGSVATGAGAKALIEAGADGLRVGMGPGSICSTRIVAGMGVPQITAVLNTFAVAKHYKIPVISDGGIRFSGDIVKAISAGASAIMAGSLFAGCDETPGKVITKNDRKYKVYRGMGSVAAMKDGSAARYGQHYRVGQEKKLIAEGVEGLVPYKGALEEVVTQLVGGLRAGMYYAGVKNIQELQEKTRLMRITQASLTESHPHDIIV